MTPMTDEDRALDALWRQHFGEPLPILGAGPFVRQVLAGRVPAAPPEPEPAAA